MRQHWHASPIVRAILAARPNRVADLTAPSCASWRHAGASAKTPPRPQPLLWAARPEKPGTDQRNRSRDTLSRVPIGRMTRAALHEFSRPRHTIVRNVGTGWRWRLSAASRSVLLIGGYGVATPSLAPVNRKLIHRPSELNAAGRAFASARNARRAQQCEDFLAVCFAAEGQRANDRRGEPGGDEPREQGGAPLGIVPVAKAGSGGRATE